MITMLTPASQDSHPKNNIGGGGGDLLLRF